MIKQNRLFICTAMIMLLFISCTTSPPSHMEENKSIIRQWTDAINQGNLDIVDELFDPNVVAHEPTGDVHGTEEGPKQVVTIFQNAFPDINFTLKDLIAEGDRVTSRWTATGTHKGEFLGIPPTEKQVMIKGIYIYRITGGKIVEVWPSRDDLGLLQQLGAIPSP